MSMCFFHRWYDPYTPCPDCAKVTTTLSDNTMTQHNQTEPREVRLHKNIEGDWIESEGGTLFREVLASRPIAEPATDAVERGVSEEAMQFLFERLPQHDGCECDSCIWTGEILAALDRAALAHPTRGMTEAQETLIEAAVKHFTHHNQDFESSYFYETFNPLRRAAAAVHAERTAGEEKLTKQS